jgi:hypothetical protein
MSRTIVTITVGVIITVGSVSAQNWTLLGNAGTDSTENFIGTTDDEAVVIRVNDREALRIYPRLYSPNIVAGRPTNNIDNNAYGAVIAGGGGPGWEEDFVGGPNTVSSSGKYSTICGGAGNVIEGWFSTIGGGCENETHFFSSPGEEGLKEYEGSGLGTVGGGWGNIAYSGCTVGGGVSNTAGVYNGLNATVAGGCDNFANSASFVGGGVSNKAVGGGAVIGGGSSNKADGNDAVIGGGNSNGACDYATVSGGKDNIASKWYDIEWIREADYAVIGGGSGNWAARPYATISGGEGNVTEKHHATIGGGGENTVNGAYSTVGGGWQNKALVDREITIAGGFKNEANKKRVSIGGGSENKGYGEYATIAGGYNNKVEEGSYGTIGGGRNNDIKGDFAVVPGGLDNSAEGDYSFAAGRRAKAEAEGCFVWADGNDADLKCTVQNGWLVRATGGVRFITGWRLTLGPVGAALPAGEGIWVETSSREVKENVSEVDKEKVLTDLARVSINTWNYRSQTEPIRHIGPMAEDFYATFGVGLDDKHLAAADVNGVALASIQALYEQLQEKDMEIAELQTRIDELDKRISELSEAVSSLE